MVCPLTKRCIHCDEAIGSDDPYTYANGSLAHRECFLRGILGSIAHIEKRCSCFVPGSEETDPPGITRREAAKAAIAAWKRLL